MKAIEKALLIKELHQLIDGLEHQHLSFFEIARSKKRIREIFARCDEPIFHKQLEAYKALTQPQATAEHWLQQSPYRHLYVGLFQYESALSSALKQQQHFAWGVLYKSGLGWQISFQDASTHVYNSPWFSKFKEVYQWLIDHSPVDQQLNMMEPIPTTLSTHSTEVPKSFISTTEVAEANPFITPVAIASNTTNHVVDLEHAAISKSFVFSDIEHLDSSTVDISVTQSQEPEKRLPESNLAFDLTLAEIKLESDDRPYTSQLEAVNPRIAEEKNVGKLQHSQVPLQKIGQDKKAARPIDTALDLPLAQIAKAHSGLDHLALSNDSQVQPQSPSIKPLATSARLDVPTIVPEPNADSSKRLLNSEISSTASPGILPTQIHLGQYQAQLLELDQTHLDPKLYRLDISVQTDISQNVDLLLYSDQLDHWSDYPIYLAEQTSLQGRFIKYLALFGADSSAQAVRLSQQFAQSNHHQLAAIREIEWEKLQSHVHDVFSIFQVYTQQAKLVWHIENYHPFILADLLNSRKFIQFEESTADLNTPILVLKERQKIRVIHGQRRVELSRTEIAYPCLVLDRQHGVSWQLIQNTISTLAEPITVFQLFDSIQKQLTNEL